MPLTDHHMCWPVPLLLLVVVTSAWIISSLYGSSASPQTGPGEVGDGKNATLSLPAIITTRLLSQINHTTSSVECVCPPPYARVMDQCYYANKFHELQWEEAHRFCQGMGGELAQPRHVNALLVFLLETYGKNVSRWYLGGTDADEEGNWRWIRGEPVSHGEWSQGEPNGNTEENCLEFCFVCQGNENPFPYPALNDEACDTRLNFVCEFVMTDCPLFERSEQRAEPE
ncbi:perlucin-like protein [Panulirus ornatus]|uniref:perlucin-like protein n=1 Tax=Panulirus ornatus TaxID=150431 RepID=UPI003A8691F5